MFIIYIYIYLNFKLFYTVIKLINKFNTKSYLIWNSFSLVKKKIGRTILYFTLFLKIASRKQLNNGLKF